ncbi:MAG: tripartite tricarboxylate transporter permease [Candidatus Nanohaloarchaea archaeon]
MLDYLALLSAGVALGVLTGLVPGIHPNTVIFTSLPIYFNYDIGLTSYMSVVAGLSVSHTFHDFLPAIFLGAPEAESALSTLPGARMAMEGRGIEAFQLTVLGGVFSVAAAIFASPFLLLFLPEIYSFLEPHMAYLLAFFLSYIVFRSSRLRNSVVITVLAGALGTFSFSMQINQEFVLVPVFSGLFALPSIYHALRSDFRLPPQSSTQLSWERAERGGAVGMLAGLLAGVFPGLGAAVSTSFLSPLLDSREEFLAGMGGVNTSDILVSFVALLLIGKSRSGASVALSSISQVGMRETVFLSGTSLVAAAIAAPLALRVAPWFLHGLRRVDTGKLLLLVALALVLSTFFLTGPPGLLVLSTSSFIGYAALLSGERASCMAVLMMPAISFYLPGTFI